jgi:hypothetical protein
LFPKHKKEFVIFFKDVCPPGVDAALAKPRLATFGLGDRISYTMVYIATRKQNIQIFFLFHHKIGRSLHRYVRGTLGGNISVLLLVRWWLFHVPLVSLRIRRGP